MSVRDDNVARARSVIAALGDLAKHAVVFGATTPSLYALSPTVEARLTDDVDLLFDLKQPVLAMELDNRRFKAVRGPNVARYKIAGENVDVVPTDGAVGASRWLADVHALARPSPAAPEVRVVDPIAFLVLKLEAFEDPRRENHGDLLASRDIEDVVLVLRGVDDVLDELRKGRSVLHDTARDGLRRLFNSVDSASWVEAHIERDAASQANARRLVEQIREALKLP